MNPLLQKYTPQFLCFANFWKAPADEVVCEMDCDIEFEKFLTRELGEWEKEICLRCVGSFFTSKIALHQFVLWLCHKYEVVRL